MNERARAMLAMTVGATIGAAAGYLFFTNKGRALRRQLEPALEDLTRELGHFRGAVKRATGVANEGWKLLNEAIGDGDEQYPGSHQRSPF